MTVRLVVACTDRKSAAPGAALRAVRRLPLAARLDAWGELFWRRNPADRVPVRDLYAGDHWTVARGLAEEPPRGVRVDLWVCSAGGGLLALDDAVRPYSATFATGAADSVWTAADGAPARDVAAGWWRGLAALTRRYRRGAPPSVAALAGRAPRTPLWVVASPRYMDALLPDLLAARRRLQSPDLLTVFTSGQARRGLLAPHAVEYSARFQTAPAGTARSLLGGGSTTLNIRAAGYALKTAAATRLRAPALIQHFARVGARQPAPRVYDRQRVSAAEVERFIRDSLREDPTASHTSLLRLLRDGGRGFEYTRFRGLFRDVLRDIGARGVGGPRACTQTAAGL